MWVYLPSVVRREAMVWDAVLRIATYPCA
jgi:hypothetical protein